LLAGASPSGPSPAQRASHLATNEKPGEAYSLAAVAADCRISQVVDVRKGVHCVVPKSIFTK